MSAFIKNKLPSPLPILAIALISVFFAAICQPPAPRQANNNETVLLLHAAMRSPGSLKLLADRLEAKGFTVVNLAYPNRRLTVFECADYIAPTWRKLAAASPGRVHIIGHSMGGLVARRLLELHRPPNFGRLLTLGTPHLGSPLADKLREYDFYQKAFGPVGQELVTGRPIDWPAPWPPPYEIGLIAGSVPIGPGALTLEGPSDGTVPAESAQPKGGAAYGAVMANHSTIPYARATAELAARFLLEGSF